MNGNWEPGNWKWPIKVLVGLATVWPPVYMVLFFVMIFSFVLLLPNEDSRTAGNLQDINLIQLDRKIRNGEIKELVVSRDQIIATDRSSGVRYRTSSVDESARQEIMSAANEKDESGQPRVPKIEENTASAPAGLPVAFAGLFAAHLLTILLLLALMPFYIILAVKNPRFYQTTRIIWVVLLCTLSMFVAPVYWYLYIWRKPPVTSPAETLSAA